MAEIRDENGRKERHYLFFDGESVNGKVCKHMFTPYDLSRFIQLPITLSINIINCTVEIDLYAF